MSRVIADLCTELECTLDSLTSAESSVGWGFHEVGLGRMVACKIV